MITHTLCFSHDCITKQIQHSGTCPICDEVLTSPQSSSSSSSIRPLTSIIPNYTAAEMVEKLARSDFSSDLGSSEMLGESHILQTIMRSSRLDLPSLKRIHQALKRRRDQLELTDSRLRHALMEDFINRMLEKRESQLGRIKAEMEKLKEDKMKLLVSLSPSERMEPYTLLNSSPTGSHGVVPDGGGSPEATMMGLMAAVGGGGEERLPGLTLTSSKVLRMDEYAKYRRRLIKHMPNLEALYFQGAPKSGNVLAGGNGGRKGAF